MFDTDEEQIPIARAAKLIPGRPHAQTVVRWALRGIGQRHLKLESWRIGGRRFTSRSAIRRFVERLNDQATEGGMDQRRADQIRNAENDADTAGIT